MQSKFQQLIHEYKKDNFRVEHDRQSTDEITREVIQIAEGVLQQKYEYHFHKLPDANRAEIINMISNYTREAILPPVVEKLVQRQVTLERRVDSLVGLVERLAEALSESQASAS